MSDDKFKGLYRHHRATHPEPYTIWLREYDKRLIHELRREHDINVSKKLRAVIQAELERLKEVHINGRR